MSLTPLAERMQKLSDPVQGSAAVRRGHKYERLRQEIIHQIKSGKLKPGDPLPTERWWAERYGFARNTVRQAMRLLEQDGLINRQQGSGTFVSERDATPRGLDLFALVLPETLTGFYPSLQKNFDLAAGLRHHQLVVCNTENNVDRQASIILQLMDKHVAGVAIVPVTSPATPAYQIRQLQKAGIPVVLCHRPVDGIHAPLLEIPFFEVGSLVGRNIANRGHRRVAMFSAQRNSASLAFETGCRTALEEQGAFITPDDCFYGSSLVDPAKCEGEVAKALAVMLNRDDRPTAIFCTFDSFAEMIDAMLARMGLRVPEDISVVGVGGVARSTPLMQRITSATVDEVEVGRLAADLLDQMRRGDLPFNDHQILRPTIGLSSGQTLGIVPETVKRPSSPA